MRRVGLLSPAQRQQPFAEFVDGCWRVWLNYNKDVTSGTYINLLPDGHIDRVTVNNNEIMEITRLC